MFVLLSNIFILCQINIIIWVNGLGDVKCIKFDTNFLTVYVMFCKEQIGHFD